MHFRAALTAVALAATPILAQAGPTAAERQAQALLKTLTLRDRIAQLIVGVCYGEAYGKARPEYKKYLHWVADLRLGGLIVVNAAENGVVRNAEPHAMAVFLNQMQRAARIPLLVAADFERGSSMRVRGGALFPYAMAFGAAGDPENARYQGMVTAREARALGVQWVFAPVSDVNNNPDNPIINIRSYGENPELVARMASAFIEGAHSDPAHPILVTAKHFPGHGDTSVNSHIGLPNLTAGRERLEAVELKPFQAAIASGVDAIMSAHMLVPAVEQEAIPATVSAKVMTGLLRQELKFRNLIVTDAMDMQGLTLGLGAREAAVRSLEAGVDVLLMPPDPEGAIQAVLEAVQSGRLPRKRIDESAARVLAAKVRLGLTKKKLVELDAVADGIGGAEEVERAQAISDQAITLVKNEGGVLPLDPGARTCMILTLERRTSGVGARMLAEFQRRAREGRSMVLDSTLPRAALIAAGGDTRACTALVVVSSVTPATLRSDLRLAGELGPFLEELMEGPAPVALVSLGTPYLLAAYPKAAAYVATFSPTVPSEISAVKALFGEIPIRGRMPVSIPGFAAPGDGIQMSARARQ